MSDLPSLLDELPASVPAGPNQDPAFLNIGKQDDGRWMISYVTNGGHEVSYLEGADLASLARETVRVLRDRGHL